MPDNQTEVATKTIADKSKLERDLKQNVQNFEFHPMCFRYMLKTVLCLFRSSTNTCSFTFTTSWSHVQAISWDNRSGGGLTYHGWKEERGPTPTGERGAGAPAERGGRKVTSRNTAVAGHSLSCITIFDISRRCREELERKRVEERARQQAEAQRLIEEKRRREEEEQRRAEEERAQAMREAALLQKQVGNANVTQMYYVSCYMYCSYYKFFNKYII